VWAIIWERKRGRIYWYCVKFGKTFYSTDEEILWFEIWRHGGVNCANNASRYQILSEVENTKHWYVPYLFNIFINDVLEHTDIGRFILNQVEDLGVAYSTSNRETDLVYNYCKRWNLRCTDTPLK
jgi:hypothetical protein